MTVVPAIDASEEVIIGIEWSILAYTFGIALGRMLGSTDETKASVAIDERRFFGGCVTAWLARAEIPCRMNLAMVMSEGNQDVFPFLLSNG